MMIMKGKKIRIYETVAVYFKTLPSIQLEKQKKMKKSVWTGSPAVI
jgi:hypothetical protein